MRANKRVSGTTHVSSWKQYGWFRLAGFVALCIPYVTISAITSSNNMKTVGAVRAQLKIWSYTKESCLKEEKKEAIDLQCEHMMGRLPMSSPKEFNKTDVHTMQAWTTDVDNYYYLLLEVKADKGGNFLSYRSRYIDPDGKPLTMSPRAYMDVDTETPSSTDPVPTQFIPTEPSPESDSPARNDDKLLQNLQVNPSFQLKVE